MMSSVTGTSTRGPVTLGGMSKYWRVKVLAAMVSHHQGIAVVMGSMALAKEGLIMLRLPRRPLIGHSRTRLVMSMVAVLTV